MNKFTSLKYKQIAGFTLIEVLVALLILAVGLLGIAALQFKGLRYSNDSFMRSQISFLAYDAADRIRSISGISQNNPALAATLAGSYIGSYTVPANPGANACNQASGLENAADATNDLGCWRNSVDAALPPGSTALITAVGNLFSVILTWTDREGQAHNVNYSFRPF